MGRPSPRRAQARPEPPRPALRLWLGVLCPLCLLLAGPSPARAQQEGEPLSDNDFNIDFVIGPVLGSGRVVGLGGAYTALASGTDGARWNPATYASREPWALDWLAWDLSFGITPGTLRNSDFDNDGQTGFTYDDFIFTTLGLGFQFGNLGVGAVLTTQSYNIGGGANLGLTVGNAGLGYGFLDGQLVVGAGIRLVSMVLNQGSMEQPIFSFDGEGLEAGAVLRLADEPWRIGLAARLPVESDRADTPVALGFTLPQQVRMPWEVQAGVAWQIGPRPLNGRWIDPDVEKTMLHRAMMARRQARQQAQLEHERRQQRLAMVDDTAPPRLAHEAPRDGSSRYGDNRPKDPVWLEEEYRRRMHEEEELEAEVQERQNARARALRAMPRRHLLVSAEVIYVDSTDRGVGLESFLAQVRQTAGADPTVGFRFGVEGEPIAQYVKMRAGSYFEPSRFQGVPYRVHGTVGADIRLFSWDLFGLLDEFTLRLVPSADVAERYINVGVGLGLWH